MHASSGGSPQPLPHRPAARKGGGVGEGCVGQVQKVLHQQAVLHRHLHLNLCAGSGGAGGWGSQDAGAPRQGPGGSQWREGHTK
jgi:hypothetical protein